jgi:hypothetical protein
MKTLLIFAQSEIVEIINFYNFKRLLLYNSNQKSQFKYNIKFSVFSKNVPFFSIF